MKKVLIISPNFPPVNGADMHRIRQSLPYFRQLGWQPVVLAVDEKYVEAYSTDPLLLHTVPEDIEVYKVAAWETSRTRKYGLSSLGIRAFSHLKRKGDELLKEGHFDLVYFSTVAFHVMALGRRWKKKFGIPFILDIQDPWRNDFYLDKPRSERPPKFFIAYNIDKFLEARTVPLADGIISVSRGYCETFMQRYPSMRSEQFRVIPFGAAALDFDVMRQYVTGSPVVSFPRDKINIVYIGRGGYDMQYALEIIFGAFKKGKDLMPDIFSRVHFWFIGTSYAQTGQGQQTFLPVARKYGVDSQVTEIPDRIPYFDTLYLLRKADLLLMPGSTDTNYTASKIYPYIMAQKQLLAVFYKGSSVLDVLAAVHYGNVVAFDHAVDAPGKYIPACLAALQSMLSGEIRDTLLDDKAFEPFTARAKTAEQVDFFNQIAGKDQDEIVSH